MKTIAAVLAFACLAQCALGAVPPKKCLGAPTTQCNAVSTLQILVTSGKCEGTSSANCKTWSQSQEVFQEAFEEWWSDGTTEDVCDGDKVEVAAQAVAVAIAKVWTAAAVNVKCDREVQGFACGWSFANGETFGNAIAEALVTAAADASLSLEKQGKGGDKIADAFCFTEVRAISGVFAQAAAEAGADACTGTGQDPVSVYNDSFAFSIQKVVADAFASASARVCATEDGADVTAESLCVGEGSIDTDGTLEGDGEFCFGFGDIKACEGKGRDTCCGKKGSRFCSIKRNVCPGCKSPWKRIPAENDDREIWSNKENSLCFCNNL